MQRLQKAGGLSRTSLAAVTLSQSPGAILLDKCDIFPYTKKDKMVTWHSCLCPIEKGKERKEYATSE